MVLLNEDEVNELRTERDQLREELRLDRLASEEMEDAWKARCEHVEAERDQLREPLRRAFGVGVKVPTMFAQYLRERYPEAYEAVK